MTEKDLIQGCLREDRKAQQEVFQRYAGKMLAVCMRYARHRMEAEDMVQDSFIKVFDNIQKFKRTGSFEGWIRRIVVNTALKNIDRKSFTHEQIGIEYQNDYGADPSVYSRLSAEELMKIVQSLPDGYRIVFNLYALEGYSHKEIADMLGIGESTSRSQLAKARKMLQEQIQSDHKKIAV